MTSDRLNQLLSLLEASPDDAFLCFALAQEYDKKGEPQRALEYYLRLRSAHPDYVGLYYHLGKWYERHDQVDSAMENYRAGMAVALKQGERHAYGELQTALQALEDW